MDMCDNKMDVTVEQPRHNVSDVPPLLPHLLEAKILHLYGEPPPLHENLGIGGGQTKCRVLLSITVAFPDSAKKYLLKSCQADIQGWHSHSPYQNRQLVRWRGISLALIAVQLLIKKGLNVHQMVLSDDTK